MRVKFILFGVLFLHICCVNSYNILMLFPYAGKSLHLLFSSIALPLAENGHNVTTFTSFGPYLQHPNIEHFQPKNYLEMMKTDSLFEIDSFFNVVKVIKQMSIEMPKAIWTTPEVWELYERRNSYDVIIMMSYFNEFLFPFLDGFRGHLILVCTPGVEYHALSYSGNWLSPAVIPNIHTPYDEYMNFKERVSNSVSFILEYLASRFIFEPTLTTSVREYFPRFTNFREYYERSSLTLINGHFSLDNPVPLLPNQIEVGTINARKPKPLPKDLQKVFDAAPPEGIIYFSLGSFVPSKSIPRKYKDIFIEAFRRLPHTVIWRYDEDDLQFPPNVVTRTWLPQQDILGNPKTKVFISHCGNMGLQEAKFHGVPILGLPIAFDQPRNAARMARKEYGVVVSWEEMSVDNLLESIHLLTKDDIYYNRMKNVSKIVQDQKESPAERAVWWVEYVIRHNGAPHLRYAGQRLSLLQYIMVDVLVFWLGVLGVMIFITLRIVKYLWRGYFGTKKTKKD